MKGPFTEQIYDRFSDPEKCAGIKFDFTYWFGSFGCEATMQFNVIAEIESAKTPYTLLKPEEFKTADGSMNEAMD